MILCILDAGGRHVRRVVGESRADWTYTVQWDGKDNVGRGVAPGVHLVNTQAGGRASTGRVLVIS